MMSPDPPRSSFTKRMNAADRRPVKNLQLCYMNDLPDTQCDKSLRKEESSSSDEEERFAVPKSKSTPNLRDVSAQGQLHAKRLYLETKTQAMLEKAKQTVKLQLTNRMESIPRLQQAPKMTRIELSRQTNDNLRSKVDGLLREIESRNGELVRLLIERDSLHMQQDSMLVDIHDMIEHESHDHQSLPSHVPVDISQPGGAKHQGRFGFLKALTNRLKVFEAKY